MNEGPDPLSHLSVDWSGERLEFPLTNPTSFHISVPLGNVAPELRLPGHDRDVWWQPPTQDYAVTVYEDHVVLQTDDFTIPIAIAALTGDPLVLATEHVAPVPYKRCGHGVRPPESCPDWKKLGPH